MKIIAHLFLSVFLLLLSNSCKKTENIVVPNNVAPPDLTIPNSVKENYINKVYISVLGREPITAELDVAFSILNQNNLSTANRKQFLDTVFANNVYYDRLYQIARADLLNNLDTTEITFYMALFQSLLTNPAYQYAWPQLDFEYKRLDTTRRITTQLHSETISVVEMHRRCVNNYFYDQINMGTENFVVSMFQNFLFRYPTQAELLQGKTMVDGQNAILFYQSGKTKFDFLRIFFSSDNYFEGQVRDLYIRYLFRNPNSAETSTAMVKYKNSNNYKELQKDILATDEYVGL